jgi:3-dehydroquinate dehydratase/shikimate dehydrogenase
MICVPLTEKTTEEMLAGAARAAKLGADLVEFRLDYLAAPDVAQLVKGKKVAAIFTCRPKREGGLFEGDESRRIGLLQQAMDLGAEYVDVELDSVAKIRRTGRARLIVSVHDFEGTPGDLWGVYRRISACRPDVVKIATTAKDIADNLAIFEVLRRADQPTIAIAMGERGVISRILAAKFGGFLTFAALEPEKTSAAGQVTVEELTGLYHYGEINGATEVFGVIAKPVAHSMSPLIHNAAFADCGMNRVYLPFLVDEVTEFVARFRGLPVKGFSVTIPHKERAMDSAEEVDEQTRRIGALNTLVERGGKLVGRNTDCSAAMGAMERALGGPGRVRGGAVSSLSGKRAAVIGARGTARAVAFGLVEAGARVRIYNRTTTRARTLAAELSSTFPDGPRCEWSALDELSGLSDADVIVNTTPVGMHPRVDESIVLADALRKGMLVFDAVYNPVETKLIREARERGALTVTGLEMFVAQAAEQFELFTGEKPPVEVMRSAVEARLGRAAK